MAYEKQTWDNNSEFNPTRMNHIENGIYSASISLFAEYTKSTSVTTGSYPTNKLFFISIYGAINNTPMVSAFIDSKNRLNKRLYLDSSHSIYMNQSGAFDMSGLEDGSTVVIYAIG